MIVNLKIENFRSIRNEAEFSMRASSGSHLSDHLIDLPDQSGKVIRTAGFYGPNASGKSNVLKAFAVLTYIVSRSGGLKENKPISCYEPYALSTEKNSAPIKLEIEFVVSDLRYIYKVHFTKNEIIFESLDCFLSRVSSNLFVRDEGGWENIKFGNAFKGGNKKISFFPNNSYLSKIGASASAPEMVKDVYKYFDETLSYIRMGSSFDLSALKDEESRAFFAKTTGDFLSLVDTGISSIKVEEKDISYLKLPDELEDEIKERIIWDNKYQFMFNHVSEDGSDVYLEQENESDGTNRLFELTPALLGSFVGQRVYVVDEIDHNIHPHIAAMMLRLFNDSELNKFGSQLIFSTHNMELMKPEKMRRDQIWFAEKIKGATNIFSLDDFEKDKVKSSTPFNKWYDEGRFGGTPDLDYLKIKNYFMGLVGSKNKLDESADEDIFGNLDDLPDFD